MEEKNVHVDYKKGGPVDLWRKVDYKQGPWSSCEENNIQVDYKNEPQ